MPQPPLLPGAVGPAQLRVPNTKEELWKLYQTPGHPIAYSAPSKIYEHFRGQLSYEFIKEALEHLDVYTLHREYKKTSVNNPYFSYIRRKNFQADLISVMSLKNANDGINYLHLIVDIFSRKIWVIPQKDKSARTTMNALRDWLDDIANDSHPEKQLLTDSGREYKNAICRALFNNYNVKHDTSRNVHKAALAERANKTLQTVLYKYLTDKGEERYIDVLGDLVRSYNNRPHRSLDQHSPNFADKKAHELLIRGLHASRYAKRHKIGGRKKKFSIGNTVRVKTYGTGINTARRAYLQQFKGELFTVEKINTILPVPMYFIKSMDTEEEIAGGFYANELQRIRGDSFKIEEVLRRRRVRGITEYYVKWKYFGPNWNSWVKETDLV